MAQIGHGRCPEGALGALSDVDGALAGR
jgi:hypothetical protein